MNFARILLVAWSSFVLLGRPANAAINFAAAKSYQVGTSPVAIAVGDFNEDGKPDIAVANSGSGDVSILLGNGDGTLQPATNFSTGNSPQAIAVGDFNGDGKLDLAVFQPGSNGVAGSVGVLLGNGDGTFQAPKMMTFGQTATFMAVADFNLDKKSDLAVCDSTGLNVLIGNGDGTFQTARNTALSSTCTGLATADFNGDGKPDLAYGSTSGVQILIGKGDGTFTQGASVTAADTRIVIATDINRDGKADLVVNTYYQTSCIASPPPCLEQTITAITLFLGNGDGTFQSGRTVVSSSFYGPRGPTVSDPLVGDFNGDGKPDLAYRTRSSSGVIDRFVLGKGDGSFSSPVLDIPSAGFAETVAQDLNGDKLADLIAVGTTNNIEVCLNTSPTSGADLSLLSPSVSAGPYVVGANLTFTADVLNQGPLDASAVTFTDTLPNGVNFVSATATPGSCVQANGIVSCNIGALPSAFDSKVSIIATPLAVGTITNSMSVTGNEPDLVPGNNSATQSLTIVPLVTLTVTDAGGGGGTVTANLGAINCGSVCSGNYAQGTSVSLTATPAAGSIFSSWSGACVGTDPNTCTIVMNSAQAVTATFALAPDFTLSPASSTFTLQTGAQATDVLTVAEQNGFSGQVNLSCMVSGPMPLATCKVSPSSVTVGSNPGSSTLTITAPVSLTALAVHGHGPYTLVAYAGVLPISAVLLGVIGSLSRRPAKRRIGFFLLGSGVIAFFVVLAGCGGSSTPPPPPPAKDYTITVSATSASSSNQHSTVVKLTVQ